MLSNFLKVKMSEQDKKEVQPPLLLVGAAGSETWNANQGSNMFMPVPQSIFPPGTNLYEKNICVRINVRNHTNNKFYRQLSFFSVAFLFITVGLIVYLFR